MTIGFELRLPGPVDVPASLEPFRRWGDDGLDRWDGATLVRTVPTPSGVVAYACTSTGTLSHPVLRVVAEGGSTLELQDALQSMFILPPPDYPDLLARDPVLAALEARYPGVRQARYLDLYTALVRAISAQQVNLTWAATTRRRLAEAFGERHTVAGVDVWSLDPVRLASVEPTELRALQFTTRKAEYIVGVAQAMVAGDLDTDTLATAPDHEVIARLTAVRGLGLWTAEWMLLRVLGRPRVVAGDLGVRKAVALAYLNAPIAPEDEVRRATAHWGASAAVAQTLLLHAWSEGTL
jgi:DNA-3-methyladenine glycosylase II